MITIKVLKAPSGSIFSIEAIGHSGYGHHGEDIVCAAVSTLMQTLITGLVEVIKLKNVKENVNAQKVLMRYSWQADKDGHADVLAKTIFLSLKGVAIAYPKYVVIIEEEYNEHTYI